MPQALAALALLLALSGPAAALEASVHGWQWAVFEDRAQVLDDLLVTGPGADLRLDMPAGARELQVFVDGTAAPWAWVGPGIIEVHLARLASQPAAEVHVQVRYVVPVGPGGVQAQREITLPTREFTVGVTAPEGWTVALDGAAREHGGLGSKAPGEVVALRVAPAAGPSPLFALGGLLALVLAATMLRAARAKGRALPAEMGLLDHLRELQSRLKVIVLAVALLMLFLFTFALQPVHLGGVEVAVPMPSFTENIAAQTFRLVAQQFVPPGVELVVFSPVSGALVQVEVALVLAVLVATPLIAYELGSFLTPALMPSERRLLMRAVPAATGLFVAGALFAYALMVPTMMRILYSYAEGLGARPLISVDALVGFAVVVTLVFGLAFELPLGMVALAKLGVVSPQAMAAKWRHAALGVFVLAAIITPDPSVVSQVMVAVPLLGLYAVGVVASRAAVRTPADGASPSAA